MAITVSWRRLALAALTGGSLAVVAGAATIAVGTVSPATAQVSGEFQAALQPYGSWRRHARWGVVWVPSRRPRDWQPYSYGHWVYTDEWGWYWISDREEEDWGWVTYHYGRWVLDRGMGWVWIHGNEWGPAWVNWRRGGDVVGWSPLPPDIVIANTEAEPAYWIFVQPRHLLAPRVRGYFVPRTRTAVILRSTVVVNRTLSVERGRVAVNAGIAPAVVGAAARTAVQTYRVQPRVLAGTKGVTGAVTVRPQDLSRRPQRGSSRFGVAVQKTSTVIQPATSVPAPQALGKGERGHLGTHPPQAAQSGGAAPPQQQAPAAPPQQKAPAAPPPRSGSRPEARPGAAAPAVNAPAPPVVAPVPGRPGEPAQAKPARPIAPQTPPPPPPKSGAQPVPPAAKPIVAPIPPDAQKPRPPRRPGERRDDRN